MRPLLRRAAAASAFAVLVLGAGTASAADLAGSSALREAVTVDGVMAHLRSLDAAAARHGGNRAAGTAGYDASAEYVEDLLEGAGYTVERERFDFPFFEEIAPPVLRSPAASRPVAERDVRTLRGSGSGELRAPVRPVDLVRPAQGASTSGCEVEDFTGFPRDAIALVRRGTCTFQVKAQNATKAGAVAVIIMNEGQEGRADVFSGGLQDQIAMPVVAVATSVGETMARTTGDVVLDVRTRSGTRSSYNLLARRSAGDASAVVLAGAHLDSVPEGPGINDNGSGVAALLEAAVQLARIDPEAASRVRLGFWGAEEAGLVGSRHHADRMSEEEQARTAAVLNFDMVGSPNFGRFVYRPEPARDGSLVPAGARRIEQLFTGYFEASGIPFRGTPMRGGSDHAAFAAKGMAVGGIYSGAGERKPAEEQRLFGGEAAAPYDACYHEACDTIANIDRDAIAEHADAVAHALLMLGRELGSGSRPRS